MKGTVIRHVGFFLSEQLASISSCFHAVDMDFVELTRCPQYALIEQRLFPACYDIRPSLKQQIFVRLSSVRDCLSQNVHPMDFSLILDFRRCHKDPGPSTTSPINTALYPQSTNRSNQSVGARAKYSSTVHYRVVGVYR